MNEVVYMMREMIVTYSGGKRSEQCLDGVSRFPQVGLRVKGAVSA